jgi:hypothetical protein
MSFDNPNSKALATPATEPDASARMASVIAGKKKHCF